MATNAQAIELSDSLIQQIRAKATGSTIHMVCGLIGTYWYADKCCRKFPNESEWMEMKDRIGRQLYAYHRTGNPECLKSVTTHV